MTNSVAYANTSNGLLFDTSTTSNAASQAAVANSVFYGNGAYGISSNSTNVNVAGRNLLIEYNAFGANSSGRTNSNFPEGEHVISLSGDPFANGAGGVSTVASTRKQPLPSARGAGA